MDRERTRMSIRTEAYFNDFVVHQDTPSVSTAASSRASISRTAPASGRVDATATAADSDGRPARSLVRRKTASWSCFCDRRQIYGDRAGPAIEGKPGTIRAGRRRRAGRNGEGWPRSGCPSRAQASNTSMPESFASTRKKNPSVSPCWATQLTIFSANASAFSSSLRPGIRS